MFTNCPECGTVFRISATDLRVAEGFVRCGTCSATFNALASLSDEPPTTVTLEQLIVRDDVATPSTGHQIKTGPEVPLPPPTPAGGPAAAADTSADEPDVDAFADALGGIAIQPPDQPVDALVMESGAGASAGGGDALEFDVPEDNWSRFFEDTGVQLVPALQLPGQVGEFENGAQQAEPAPPPGSEEWRELLIDVPDDDGEAGAAPVYVIGEDLPAAVQGTTVPEPRGTSRFEVDASTVDQPAGREPELTGYADEHPAPVPGAADGPVDGFLIEPVPGTAAAESLVAGPRPDWIPGPEADAETEQGWAHKPMAWMPEPAPRQQRRSALYALGSVILLLLLAGQVINHQRDELAASVAWGKPFRTVYGRLGFKLYPAWNLGAYDVRATEAVAGRTAQGALDILARISVTGTEPVGLPLVRVVLRDRWSNPIGSRVFTPDEYVGDRPLPPEPLAPGALLPIRISLADPGTEAYGYEVDVCLMTRTEGLQCQQEREPFRR